MRDTARENVVEAPTCERWRLAHEGALEGRGRLEAGGQCAQTAVGAVIRPARGGRAVAPAAADAQSRARESVTRTPRPAHRLLHVGAAHGTLHKSESNSVGDRVLILVALSAATRRRRGAGASAPPPRLSVPSRATRALAGRTRAPARGGAVNGGETRPEALLSGDTSQPRASSLRALETGAWHRSGSDKPRAAEPHRPTVTRRCRLCWTAWWAIPSCGADRAARKGSVFWRGCTRTRRLYR